MKKGNQYALDYQINYYDIDKNENIKIPSLIDICNNVSSLHSEVYSVGTDYLKEKDYAWVFIKSQLILKKIPKFLDRIKITTYSVGGKRFFASRYFDITDQKGQEIGRIKGLYCLINTKTRKPINIPKELMEKYETESQHITLRDLKLNEPTSSYKENKFNVRFFDIDTNGHVNNGVYILWALESLPLQYHENLQLTSLEIIFEKEIVYGDIAHIKTYNLDTGENEIIQAIYNDKNEVTTLLKTTWK